MDRWDGEDLKRFGIKDGVWSLWIWSHGRRSYGKRRLELAYSAEDDELPSHALYKIIKIYLQKATCRIHKTIKVPVPVTRFKAHCFNSNHRMGRWFFPRKERNFCLVYGIDVNSAFE